MKKLFRARKKVTLYVDTAELLWIETQAPGSVSAWARTKILEGMPRREVPVVDGTLRCDTPVETAVVDFAHYGQVEATAQASNASVPETEQPIERAESA